MAEESIHGSIQENLKRPERRKRFVWMFCAGLLAVGAVLFYLHYWTSRPIGDGPAGPLVNRESFNRTWTQRKVVLVGLGDSITAGFGARPGFGYFERLRSSSAHDYNEMEGINLSAVLPNLNSTNLSVSGSISVELAEVQLPRLLPANTNTLGLVVITTGGNDLIHNYGRTPPREQAMYGATIEQSTPWLKNFEARLGGIIDAITKKFPGGSQIFVGNIYDPTDGYGDIQKTGLPAWPDAKPILERFNSTIARVVGQHKNAHLVNLHDAFLGHGIHCTQFWSKHYDARDPHYWYFENLEDPNERGYDVIRRIFLIEISKFSKEME